MLMVIIQNTNQHLLPLQDTVLLREQHQQPRKRQPLPHQKNF
jgi:hypothetical protein